MAATAAEEAAIAYFKSKFKIDQSVDIPIFDNAVTDKLAELSGTPPADISKLEARIATLEARLAKLDQI